MPDKVKAKDKHPTSGKAPDKLLNFVDDGVEFMKLVVDVSVYWTGSARTHADGLLHFYREALAVIKDRLKFYEREYMTRGGKPLTPAALNQLPDFLAGANRDTETFTLDLQGGTDAKIPSDVAFRFWASEYEEDPAGMIRLVLPTTFIQESPAALLKLTLSLVQKLRFHSGHAGYAINWDHRGDLAHDARVRMGILARRFPAIDISEIVTTLMAIPTGMKRINWITLVGDGLMKEKGLSPSALENLEVHRVPHGVAVVAGDKPLLGDVNRKEDLSAYRRVGKALAPLRSQDSAGWVSDQDGDPDDGRTEEWLAYFDK